MALTAIQQLDEVLKFIALKYVYGEGDYDSTYRYKTLANIEAYFKKNAPHLEVVELHRMLNKLVADKFVETIDVPQPDPSNPQKCYALTFDGQLHVQKKGYYQKEKDKARKRRNLNRVNFCLAAGTASAGLYALIEIGKYLLTLVFGCR